ncbi:MAG: outer membrane protein [Janthinobacterium lividum]
MLRQNILISIYCATFATTAYSQNPEAVNADQRSSYLGIDAGISDPLQHKFKDKKSGTKLSLKKSTNYSARIGYSFYPQMALELSSSYQPKYNLGYTLPAIPNLPIMFGKTKVGSQIYSLNLVYDLKDYDGFTPYVGGGIGLARILTKPANSSLMDQDFFRIKKDKSNFFAWQAKIGILKNISNDLSFNLTGQLQVVQNIKINYETINMMTGKFNPGTVKKTIGAYELSAGLVYKIPYKG